MCILHQRQVLDAIPAWKDLLVHGSQLSGKSCQLQPQTIGRRSSSAMSMLPTLSLFKGKSYPTFAKVQKSVDSKKFYAALFSFANYWEKHLEDRVNIQLPDSSWADMSTHAFAKELMTRPGGNYPKYGAFDRDYAGSEYDGFQDIFTSAVSANLEHGRFNHAKDVIENYYTLFVSDEGDINMRGPQVGQFGLTLSLLAKYAHYTGDTALLQKHKAKIVATAGMLVKLHEEGLALPNSDSGHGLIHGWSESDACLKGRPEIWWKPYFSNSAFTIRGFRDIAALPLFKDESANWLKRADALQKRTVESIKASIMTDKGKTLYVPPLPGTKQTFRESMAARGDSEQAWPHRLYAELLHANILPKELQNQVQDTVRAYGASSMGVIANVGVPSPATRDILGFISYGSALSLLYLDRIDEFVLFLYSHRYHVHNRGAWLAGEVTGTAGGVAAFCVPAQMTIPIILRWALVLEDQDSDLLYLGRGVPREWLGTGKAISIKQAPTRWGRVDYSIMLTAPGKVRAQVKFSGKVPKEIEVKLRFPKGGKVKSATVNGKEAKIAPNEAVLVQTDGQTEFIVEAIGV
ncbi:hypothetical protein BT63DRAFT_427925 [Microthyrium microscopicum]|uniref:Uncharacterized protein n=1 Tax=Microthyrium microscopicum TaxID=703497 RepID=A0A6A6U5C6_9PEZI|nr:hypothetical protein BT63DRAFT_427925 [Microthyrium microscopicum]